MEVLDLEAILDIGNVDLTEEATEEINTIPNNLYAREMRMTMENKNLLATKGSIYIGTGCRQTLSYKNSQGQSIEIDVPITTRLDPPEGSVGKYYLTWDCATQTIAWERFQ